MRQENGGVSLKRVYVTNVVYLVGKNSVMQKIKNKKRGIDNPLNNYSCNFPNLEEKKNIFSFQKLRLES